MISKTKSDLKFFEHLIEENYQFRFCRFTDGETEILLGNYFSIKDGRVNIYGKTFQYPYQLFDKKEFDPKKDKSLRDDLWLSLKHLSKNYYIGIPTSHNDIKVRDMYLSWLKSDKNVTFADLLNNENYKYFLRKIFPKLMRKKNLFCIANEFCKPNECFSGHIKIPNNVFPIYDEFITKAKHDILGLPDKSIILSSASSLSNIFAHFVDINRPDITLIDIGTAINEFLGLPKVTRVYHVGYYGPRSLNDIKMYLNYKLRKKDKLIW